MTATVAVTYLFGCFTFGVLSVRSTTQGLILIGATFCVVVYWIRPQIMFWIALFMSCAALPEGLPPGKVIGPVVIYGHHVPLLLAICYLVPLVRPHFVTYVLPVMFTVAVVFYTAVGFAAGHTAFVVVREASFLLEMVAGFMLAVLIIHGGYLREAIRVMAVTLWFSAAVTVAESLHLIKPLTGRIESIAGETGASEATRIITNTLQPAIGVLTALIAALIAGRVKPTTAFLLGPPALLIPLLAFSRNTLIAVGVAVIVAAAASGGWLALRRVAKVATIIVAVFAVSVPGALFLLQRTSAGSWLSDQFTGFNERVLGGVSSTALAADSSTKARLDENAALVHAFKQTPVLGHGLGFAYRLPYGKGENAFDVFADTLGTTYSHNFYLWWLAKSGLAGMAIFAAFAFIPLVRALRRASAPAKAAAAVSAGLLVMSIVDPMPEDVAGALTIGMAIGSAMAFATLRDAESRDDHDAPAEPELVGVPT